MRYKSLVFRFNLRCFPIQITRFTNSDTRFYELNQPLSTYNYPNSGYKSQLPNNIPTLFDTIPSFPDQNFPTSTHRYPIFMMRLPQFQNTNFLFSNSDTRFYVLNPKISNPNFPTSPHNFGKSKHKSTVLT